MSGSPLPAFDVSDRSFGVGGGETVGVIGAAMFETGVDTSMSDEVNEDDDALDDMAVTCRGQCRRLKWKGSELGNSDRPLR